MATDTYKGDGFDSVEALIAADREDDLNLAGRTINQLTVLRRVSDREGYRKGNPDLLHFDYWEVRCSCGNELTVAGNSLRKDKAQKSCGHILHPNHRHYRAPGGGL